MDEEDAITERDQLPMGHNLETFSANGAATFSAYGAAMRGDWKNLIQHYKLNKLDLRVPITLSGNTALHIAVCSKKEQPLPDLVDILPLSSQEDLLKCKNTYGNTVLHEATIHGNLEAVKLLVERFPGLVSIKNEFGETPLFTAAEFAEPEIVKFLLLSVSGQLADPYFRLQLIHRQRERDKLSILSAAILGQQYETALMLLDLDESLHEMMDEKGITALQLLAHSPSAFESGYPMGILGRLIYCCLPVPRRHKVQSLKSLQETLNQVRGEGEDMESGLGRNPRSGILNYQNVLTKASKMTSTLSSCKFFAQGYWPARLQRFWDEKRKHVFASKLAKILIEKDSSWNLFEGHGGRPELTQYGLTTSQVIARPENEHSDGQLTSPYEVISTVLDNDNERHPQASKEENPQHPQVSKEENPQQRQVSKEVEASKEKNPLFTATSNGIEEIVRKIIEQHPQAIEYLNDRGQSILDVAVMHRKKKIFSFVKRKKIPLARLRLIIDKEGNTLLHHAADQYRGGTRPGPALQLQEELRWFERVRKVIPSHYVALRNEKSNTAEELFKTNHQNQLKMAQKWMKETAQSCSTVAALVATVVFAAAYTVPGGSDEEGTPNFINSPYFLVFTVSDVVSLASSLTSLVVFLSLLTSPFDLKDFHVSLPRRLIIGFTFLFFSVITTMLSFGATILILIQSERKLTTLLLSIASFLPVMVFAIMQFRLYFSFMGSTLNFHNIITKALPSCLVRRPPGGKKRC